MRARRIAVPVAVLLAVAVAASARAEDRASSPLVVAQSGPVRLVPPERPAAPPRAGDEQPPPARPDATPRESVSHRRIQNIEVNPLSGPDPDAAGVLYGDNGGLGYALWDGVPREVIARLVRRLPAGIASPALRDVVRRLLLTAAALPPAADDSGDSLIALRVDRLQAMGMLGSAAELIAVAPNRETDERLQRLRAENALMRNDLGGACAEASRQQQRLEDLFWQKLLIYCQAVRDDTAGASLGANLLVETGQLDDPAFFVLIDRLVSGNAARIDSLAKPTPLLLSLARTANVPVPADAMEQASPPLLGMIGSSPNVPIDIRLEAAERAALNGAMTADRLAEVYASVTFSKEDLDNALSIADVTRTSWGRALLYQAAQGHSVPTARAAVVQKAFALAQEDGRYALAVRVYETVLTGLQPSGELGWFAADAGRALYVLGRADLADRWLAELRRQAVREPEAGLAADALWAIATLAEAARSDDAETRDGETPRESDIAATALSPRAGAATTRSFAQRDTVPPAGAVRYPSGDAGGTGDAETPIDSDRLASWRAALRATALGSAARHTADAFLLMSAAGIAVGDDAWRMILGEAGAGTAISPDPAYRAMLSRAAERGRRGEAILLAALIVGEAGLSEMDMTAIADVVAALRQVGLAREAGELAVEAAIQAGL